MIQIEDYDSPIVAAGKIINGSRKEPTEMIVKLIFSAMGGEASGETDVDMFDLEEIKEIADYLLVYYNAHGD